MEQPHKPSQRPDAKMLEAKMFSGDIDVQELQLFLRRQFVQAQKEQRKPFTALGSVLHVAGMEVRELEKRQRIKSYKAEVIPSQSSSVPIVVHPSIQVGDTYGRIIDTVRRNIESSPANAQQLFHALYPDLPEQVVELPYNHPWDEFMSSEDTRFSIHSFGSEPEKISSPLDGMRRTIDEAEHVHGIIQGLCSAPEHITKVYTRQPATKHWGMDIAYVKRDPVKRVKDLVKSEFPNVKFLKDEPSKRSVLGKIMACHCGWNYDPTVDDLDSSGTDEALRLIGNYARAYDKLYLFVDEYLENSDIELGFYVKGQLSDN